MAREHGASVRTPRGTAKDGIANWAGAVVAVGSGAAGNKSRAGAQSGRKKQFCSWSAAFE